MANTLLFTYRYLADSLSTSPQIIENIPSRFHGLEGKTIAIDATLVTQRLHFTPDPRPYRHVLGWYQLIAELRQHKIKAICVFDGKDRIPAKLEEVARRRQLRLQAETRAVWEKSRHERLLSLTEALLNLELLPQDQQKDVLGNIQGQAEPIWSQPRSDGINASSALSDPSSETAQPAAPVSDIQLVLESPAPHVPVMEESDVSSSSRIAIINPSSGIASDPSITKRRSDDRDSQTPCSDSDKVNLVIEKDVPHARDVDVKPTAWSEQKEPDSSRTDLDQVVLDVQPNVTQRTEGYSEASLLEYGPASKNNSAGTAENFAQSNLDEHSSKRPSNVSISGTDVEFDQSIGAGIAPIVAQNQPNTELDFPAGNNDNAYLSKIIGHLHDHYIRTSAASLDGHIYTGFESENESVLDIPISRVQLKYTKEESKLWEQLVPGSKGYGVDITSVVEQVKQLASAELPKDEIDLEASEEEIEQAAEQKEISEETTPISEWAATLEEQSGLMVASLTRRANPPSSSTYAESRLILETMGVPCVESPMHYEAEALASSIVINGLADFVGSEDTDVLMYNAPLLRHVTNRKVPLQIIPPDTQNGLGLSRSAFIDTGILMGTDFVKRVKKIGPITAYRLMQKHGSIERMLEEEPKLRPSDVADYLEKVKVARLIFSSLPPVPLPESIAQGDWDEQAIQETMAHFGLIKYMKEIEEQLIPDALSDNYFQESKGLS